ncbi:hypothetical protein [Parendozoicomonas sp. Alg238-R29]|uniref:hypothetical protein n=1 Tax=Parendozoicomonas sp. Alg238-R29 TaxID=2993446 RepID=UPI00248F147E|nr:hypothetical protein [Parendozoicomonas sp. Alg238-R29]
MVKFSTFLCGVLGAAALLSGVVQASERFEITPPPGWQLEDTRLHDGVRTDLYQSGDLELWTVFDRAIKENVPAKRVDSLSEQAALAVHICEEPAVETLNAKGFKGDEALVVYRCQPKDKEQSAFVAFSKLVKGEEGWYRFGLEKEFDDLAALTPEHHKVLQRNFLQLADMAFLCEESECEGLQQAQLTTTIQQAIQAKATLVDFSSTGKSAVATQAASASIRQGQPELVMPNLGKGTDIPPLLQQIIYQE